MPYVYAIHGFGETTKSGAHRSACYQFILDGPHKSGNVLSTRIEAEVTCVPCLKKMCLICAQPGMKPAHKASDRCESGKRDHCSCEVCW